MQVAVLTFEGFERAAAGVRRYLPAARELA